MCHKLFASRAHEAEMTKEITPRLWTPKVIAYSHWQADYITYAKEVNLPLSFEEAVETINEWIDKIDT